MKAIVLHEYGGPEVLRYEEVERPAAGKGQLLLKVHAVSVNRSLDLWVRQDGGGYDIELPYVMGIDPSGVVEEVGEAVDGFAKGDRVTSILPPFEGGAYAEYAVTRADRTYQVPSGLGLHEATVVSRHFPMAHSLCRTGEVENGKWVLVMGAAGALGAAAVQVLKHRGANVIVAAGTDARVESALELGGNHGVNYRTTDLAVEVRKITNGKGVDAVFENIADPTLWPGAFGSLARRGILVTVGAHGGGEVALDVRTLYREGLSIRSGLWNTRPEDADDSLALAAAGDYRVAIRTVLPLSQAAEAHRVAMDAATFGKVLMDPTLG